MVEKKTLQELAQDCWRQKQQYATHSQACLHCDNIEFCNSYVQFLKGIAPSNWRGSDALPDVSFDRSGFYSFNTGPKTQPAADPEELQGQIRMEDLAWQ